MKLIFYLIIIFQSVILCRVYANKLIVDLLNENTSKWEKYNDKKEKINKIIWKSYQDDESYFDEKSNINKINLINNDNNNKTEKFFFNNKN